MDIDIVICSNRSEHQIDECLNNLYPILPGDSKVIIIVPKKHPILQRSQFKKRGILIIPSEIENGSFQRNVGLMYCSSQIVGFIDDDTILYTNHIRNIIGYFERHKEVIGIGGHIINFSPAKGWLLLYRKVFGLSYPSEDGSANQLRSGFFNYPDYSCFPKKVEALWGCCMWWRRDAFINVKFNENLTAFQDIDFSYQLRDKGELINIADAMYTHSRSQEGRSNIKRIFAQIIAAKNIGIKNNNCNFSYILWLWGAFGMIIIFILSKIIKKESILAPEFIKSC
jgi:cellulose synthase/poly-beta-1,6-N-acetylglucosamine synthase-like glycosyltransferase